MSIDEFIISPYFKALAILLASQILLQTGAYIIQKIALRVFSRTKTELDDILIKKTFFPLALFLFFVSLRISVNQLVLNEGAREVVHHLIYSGVVISLGVVGYVIINTVIGVALHRFTSRTNNATHRSLAAFIESLLKIIIIIFVILFLLSVWGVEIGPFLAGLGIAGLAVALALQPTLSNIFSGIAMILDKSVRVGDLVYLNPTAKGRIQRIGLRSTRIISFDNELLIIPNSKLADSLIQNVAVPEYKARVVIPFEVPSGINVEKIKNAVATELKKIKEISKEENKILVRFSEMNATMLQFKAYFYVNSADDRFSAIDEANSRIYEVLQKMHNSTKPSKKKQ